MDKVLYVAMTGARENMRAQQAHANNLANATTTAFKSDLEQARAMRVLGDGHESRVYSMSERPGTNLESGTLMQTGRDLDVAVDGEGWLTVIGPDGKEVYTRNGALQINAANQLVTGSGLPVMGNGGIPIVLPPAEKIEIATDGTITIRPLGENAAELALVDQIKLVRPQPGQLFKGQDGFMHTDNDVPLPPALDVQVRSGYLEASNVNAVSDLTAMISLSRQFEMQVKMMKTAEENSSAAAKILQMS
ncbi:flagellar basal-body rod protein FlgF [Marinobacterium sediminicola]|uniref:Flagellar basal-body rod protein FlgF n=1 Tax=Marinobacterium sediminicola TaxID=518898 RepID=A0ABY1RYD5_9GAMM|nr:flagellar basal-body rod protein FlgF [Marinobacterium sediminicola]ULG68798.1 flagellar basal-body rod protein FlgF [Marinobacterium sediminicola]SMR73328.1 flagellar basal-body rod protein FlgF [Marinobacterium sediminicola]